MKNCPWMTPLSRQSELIGRLEQEASQARSYWLMMQRVETWLSQTAGSSHRARLQKQDTPQDVVPLSRQNSRRSATLLPNGVRPLDGHGTRSSWSAPSGWARNLTFLSLSCPAAPGCVSQPASRTKRVADAVQRRTVESCSPARAGMAKRKQGSGMTEGPLAKRNK